MQACLLNSSKLAIQVVAQVHLFSWSTDEGGQRCKQNPIATIFFITISRTKKNQVNSNLSPECLGAQLEWQYYAALLEECMVGAHLNVELGFTEILCYNLRMRSSGTIRSSSIGPQPILAR